MLLETPDLVLSRLQSRDVHLHLFDLSDYIVHLQLTSSSEPAPCQLQSPGHPISHITSNRHPPHIPDQVPSSRIKSLDLLEPKRSFEKAQTISRNQQ